MCFKTRVALSTPLQNHPRSRKRTKGCSTLKGWVYPDPGLQDQPVAWNAGGRVNRGHWTFVGTWVAEAGRAQPNTDLDGTCPHWLLSCLQIFFFFFLRKGLSLVWLVILSETELWKSPKLDGEQAPPPCPSSLTNLITIGLSSQFTGELEAQGTPSKLRIKFTCLSLWGVGNATDLYFTPPLAAQMVKNLPSMQETWVRCWVRKIPRRKKWQLTPVFLPGESHGQRTLAGYSSWGCKSDTTERLNHYHLTWLLCRIIFRPFFIFFSW